jgi:hypothetical protein
VLSNSIFTVNNVRCSLCLTTKHIHVVADWKHVKEHIESIWLRKVQYEKYTTQIFLRNTTQIFGLGKFIGHVNI